MLSSLIIVLREVLEAALIIGIVMAASRGVPRRGRWVSAGVGIGIAGSLLVAAFTEAIAMAVSGMGQELFNASVLLIATTMLGWHNVWMKRHGRELSRQMRDVGAAVTAGVRPLSLLLVVVGLAVLREGAEVVLFLYGIAAGGAAPLQMWLGSIGGLLAGATLGALMYFGLLRIPSRHLFAVTGWMLLLLAAGMAGQAAGYLVQVGALPALIEPLWDTSAVLPEKGVIGFPLQTLVGYDDQPSAMQVIFFGVAFMIIAALMRWADRHPMAGQRIASHSPAVQRG